MNTWVGLPVARPPRDADVSLHGAGRPATITPVRLGLAAAATLPRDVKRPGYDVEALRPGILHIGCGAFHRAHQALLTQHAIEAEMPVAGPSATPPPWGIVATSLRTPRIARTLMQQDGLYTVLERHDDRTRAEVVGSIRQALYAPDETAAFDAAFANPAIRVVTLTVTSSGYCVDPDTARLEADSPSIQHDLRTTEPRTAIGLLTRGLARRRDSGCPPPVVLSCDNMVSNGRVLRRACEDFAALSDDRLARWIAETVQFPATVVDRIVPTPSEHDWHDALRTLGVKDMAAVSAEPFSQWVIERFDGPRPSWDAAGAKYVGDVGPWEASKLRLLNGGHLVVAYLGLLAGATTVADALDRPGFMDFTSRYMLREQKPTLPSSDHDIDAYAGELLRRWTNHGIAHRLDRVGRDGSGKLQPRLLASLMDNLDAGRPAPCTLLAVAAWLLCVTKDGPTGTPLIEDDRSATLRDMHAAAGGDATRFVDAALSLSAVFGLPLRRHVAVRAGLVAAIGTIERGGSPAAMAASLDASS